MKIIQTKDRPFLLFLLRDIYLVTYLNIHPDENSHRQYENLQSLGRSIHSWSQTSRPLQRKDSIKVAEIAQLGERQTEDLKVPGSNPESSHELCIIPGLGNQYFFILNFISSFNYILGGDKCLIKTLIPPKYALLIAPAEISPRRPMKLHWGAYNCVYINT